MSELATLAQITISPPHKGTTEEGAYPDSSPTEPSNRDQHSRHKGFYRSQFSEWRDPAINPRYQTSGEGIVSFDVDFTPEFWVVYAVIIGNAALYVTMDGSLVDVIGVQTNEAPTRKVYPGRGSNIQLAMVTADMTKTVINNANGAYRITALSGYDPTYVD